MAGDTGSPQCQPTDLSMKSNRDNSIRESEKLKAYDYVTENIHKSRFKFKTDMAAYYATFDKPFDLTNNKSVITKTPTAEMNDQAIRNAITAITQSLTPTSASCLTKEGGISGRTPSDEEVFVYSGKIRTAGVVRTGGASSSRSPDVEIVERDRVFRRTVLTPTTPSDSGSTSSNLDATRWRLPTTDRPQYLDLRDVVEIRETSPDSGLGSATPVYSTAGSTTSPETPSGIPKNGKRRKRKLGPGRGWKFHDLSTDGGSSRKRTYAQNKLEIGILQRFQDHVCVKSVPTPDGSKDKLIIVEPSEITDSDLVRCGTSLRLLFDKDAGIYKLQLLPYTLEEGPLSDHERVLQAVSKMLGFNNEVLCPSAFNALYKVGNNIIFGDSSGESEQYPRELQNQVGRTLSLGAADANSVKLSVPLNLKQQVAKSPAHQRDALLWSLNSELTRYNKVIAGAVAAGRKTCLMWHTPNRGNVSGRPPKKFTPVTKWCVNCRPNPPSQSLPKTT
uniref:uncharacterized protein LOC120340350 n=1 Tax=Styela clava TaxID=7725 RepID=UPI00193A50C0|nr:uncharacterized protein LOC120340350 [Styela clava]